MCFIFHEVWSCGSKVESNCDFEIMLKFSSVLILLFIQPGRNYSSGLTGLVGILASLDSLVALFLFE